MNRPGARPVGHATRAGSRSSVGIGTGTAAMPPIPQGSRTDSWFVPTRTSRRPYPSVFTVSVGAPRTSSDGSMGSALSRLAAPHQARSSPHRSPNSTLPPTSSTHPTSARARRRGLTFAPSDPHLPEALGGRGSLRMMPKPLVFFRRPIRFSSSRPKPLRMHASRRAMVSSVNKRRFNIFRAEGFQGLANSVRSPERNHQQAGCTARTGRRPGRLNGSARGGPGPRRLGPWRHQQRRLGQGRQAPELRPQARQRPEPVRGRPRAMCSGMGRPGSRRQSS